MAERAAHLTKNIPVRILNSRRPESAGTLITADARSADGQLTAIACKRRVTVIDITSTRMLMAHGFLRRLRRRRATKQSAENR